MSAPCFCGCGELADPGSLWRAACRVRRQAEHDAIQARKQAEHAQAVEVANRESQAARYLPCARCGAPGAVLASQARDADLEAERRRVERRLRRTHGAAAHGRSIALTRPSGTFSTGDLCEQCRTVDPDFYG